MNYRAVFQVLQSQVKKKERRGSLVGFVVARVAQTKWVFAALRRNSAVRRTWMNFKTSPLRQSDISPIPTCPLHQRTDTGHHQNPDKNTNIESLANMADSATAGSTLRDVQIEALVVMRIIKHSTSTFPTPATGCLVGMDVPSASGTQLQVTNCFQYPASVPEQPQDSFYPADAAALAAAAPRAKSNVSYQNEMIKMLREVNVDAQSVGWYTSANMGNFINQNFVENQFYFQRVADEKTIALVFDVSRSSAGSLSLKAYRLSPSFMASFREGKFTTER